MEKNFTDMSGPELVAVHNQMVTTALARGLVARTVAKFVDKESGVKRCEALASSLRAAASAAKKADDEHEARGAERARAEGRHRDDAIGTPAKPVNQEEDDVAKKASKAKKNGAAPRKAKAEKVVPEGISGEFGVRAGSLRDKALAALPLGEMVTLTKLIKAVYGREATVETHGIAIHGSPLLGIKMAIDGTIGRMVKLPYELRKEKDVETKAISYGLFKVR
jgi:hypothetical protein